MNLLFYSAFLVLGLSGGLIGTSIPFLISHYSVPPEQGGLIVTIQTIGGVIANIVLGRLLDRFSSRVVIWTAPVALAASGVLMMIVTSSLGALAAMFVFGFGFGGMLVAGNTIVTRLNLPNAAPALNILSVCYGVGATVGPQVVRLILQTQPIPVAYLLIGGAQLILLPFLLRYSIKPQAVVQTNEAASAIKVSMISLVLFGAFLFVYTGAEIGFAAWISTQMTMVAGVPAVEAATFVSLFWFGITSGRIVGSLISRRLADETIILGASTMIMIVIAVFILFPSNPVVGAVLTFAFGFFCGPIFPSVLALIGRRYPEAIGKISGGLMAVGNVGVAVLPWVQGQVSGGMHGGFGVTLVCLIVLLVLGVFIARDTRREATRQTVVVR